MKKIKQIFLASIATWLLVLPLTTVNKAKALPITPQNNIHRLAATDNSTIIDHIYSQSDIEHEIGTQTLTFWYWAKNSYFAIPASGTYDDQFLYYFDGISSETNEIYLGISSKTFKVTGIYWYDRSNKKFKYTHEFTGFSALDTSVHNYLNSFNLGGHVANSNGIENYTPELVESTTSNISCPDKLGINSINYTSTEFQLDSLKGKFQSTDDENRVFSTPPKPAPGTHLKIWYTPPGAPSHLPNPILNLSPDSNGQYDLAHTPSTAVSGPGLTNLKKGTYTFTVYWSLENTGDTSNPKWILQDLDSLDWVGLWQSLQWPDGWLGIAFSAAQSITPLSILGNIGLAYYNSKRDYYLYGGSKEITVSSDQPLNCSDLAIDVTYQYKESRGGGSSDSTCGEISSGKILQWAFCEMVSAVKSLADWAKCKAMSIYSQVTNLVNSKSASSDLKKCLTASSTSSSTSTGSTSTTTTTPATDTTTDSSTYAFDKTATVNFVSPSSYNIFLSTDADTVGVIITPMNAAGGTSTTFRGSVTFSNWNATGVSATAHIIARTALPSGYSRYKIDLVVPNGPTVSLIGP